MPRIIAVLCFLGLLLPGTSGFGQTSYYVDLPEINTSIVGAGNDTRALVVEIAMKIEGSQGRSDKEWLKNVIKAAHGMLTSYKLEDLVGSVGLERVRGDLLGRVREVDPTVQGGVSEVVEI